MPEKPPEATGFTEDVEEIALAVSKLVEAELPERPHPSNICASMFAPTPPIQMKARASFFLLKQKFGYNGLMLSISCCLNCEFTTMNIHFDH